MLIYYRLKYIIACTYICLPVPVAARPKAPIVLDRSSTEMLGSNPVGSMDICPRSSVFCCPS
jgi:hypothetical protein